MTSTASAIVRGAVALDELLHARDRGAVGRDLALEVHPHLLGQAAVGEHHLEQPLVEPPGPEQLDRA